MASRKFSQRSSTGRFSLAEQRIGSRQRKATTTTAATTHATTTAIVKRGRLVVHFVSRLGR